MPNGIANACRAPWAAMISAVALVGCSAPAVGNATTDASANTASAAPAPTMPVPVPSDVRPAPSPSGALPADVTAFKARRDECDHFRGEEPTDPARARELERKLEQTCSGTDAALAALRKRYAGTAAVTAALQDYDDGVE